MEERRRLLKARQEQREYDSMIGNLNTETNFGRFQAGKEIKSAMKEISVGISMITGVAASFAAGVFWWYKLLGRDLKEGLVVGLVLGIIMLFVEMILFVIRAERQQALKRS